MDAGSETELGKLLHSNAILTWDRECENSLKGMRGATLATAAPAGFLPAAPHQCPRGNGPAGTPGAPRPSLPNACLPLPLLQLHYQHQVVQNLHRVWRQYLTLPPKAEEARPSEEERHSPRARAAYLEKASVNVEPSVHSKSPVSESQVPQQESEAFRDSRDALGSQKPGAGAQSSQRKSIMEEILVEESPDLGSTKSPWELDGLPPPEWNLCLEDFGKVLP